MEIKINWGSRRCRHAIDRMLLRGISFEEIFDALTKGSKRCQKKSGLYESFFRYFSVMYDEYCYHEKRKRKIYPITIKIW